jgi:hypothetical protein
MSATQDHNVNHLGTSHRIRLIVFRVLAALAGLFFLVAVVLMASAPWVLLQPDQMARTEANRWFLTVAGSVDAITGGVLFALAHRPKRTLLIVELLAAVIVAGAIILPFQPSFAAILAVGVIPLIAYPYWRDIRAFPTWWKSPPMPISSSPRWRPSGFWSPRPSPFPARFGGPTRPLRRDGGRTTPSTPPCSQWRESSAPAADPAGAS